MPILSEVFNCSPEFLGVVWVNTLKKCLLAFRNSNVALFLILLYLVKSSGHFPCLYATFLFLIISISSLFSHGRFFLGSNLLFGMQQFIMFKKFSLHLNQLLLMSSDKTLSQSKSLIKECSLSQSASL